MASRRASGCDRQHGRVNASAATAAARAYVFVFGVTPHYHPMPGLRGFIQRSNRQRDARARYLRRVATVQLDVGGKGVVAREDAAGVLCARSYPGEHLHHPRRWVQAAV
jgi:hypothetical protein